MNKLYWSVLRTNAARFIRCNIIWVCVIIGVGWQLFLIVIHNEADVDGSISVVLIGNAVFSILFSGMFWQYGWAVGSVDPITGFHTDKYKNDRLFVSFITSLPISREAHYEIQVLLYLLLSLIICVISFFISSLPLAQTHLALALYLHLAMFSVFVFFGGLQTISGLPYAFDGEIRSIKHPLVMRALAFCVGFMALISFGGRISAYIFPGKDFQLDNYIVNHPVFLAFTLACGGLMFWYGRKKFVNVDIK